MIHRTPFILPWLYPALTWRIPDEQKSLYLTFDDGPVPGPTEFVLDTLERMNVNATFFCIGDNVRKHPDVFRRILEHGHAVGNHTFHHRNGWKTSTEQYVDNITAAEEIMAASSERYRPVRRIFRPPYGRITRRQISRLTDYRIVMWDVLTIDYNARLDATRCLNNSIQATRAGSIIVFHDSVKAEKNLMHVLPRYIEQFQEQGYQFKLLAG